MRRFWTVLLLIVTVGVLASVVYIVGQRDVVPQAGKTPGFTGVPTTPLSPSSVAASSSSSSSRSSSASAPPRIRTVFLGDDYTLGTGASSPQKSWTTLVADALGLDATVLGVNGAGYARTSGAIPGAGKTYASLVGAAVDARPDLIVVSGGRNDVIDDPDTLRSSAAALFATLHARLPHAVLVALAPLWGDSDHPTKLAPVTAAVRAGVTAAKGRYLAVSDPLHGHKSWMKNLADPNDLGYAAISSAVIPVLRASVPG